MIQDSAVILFNSEVSGWWRSWCLAHDTVISLKFPEASPKTPGLENAGVHSGAICYTSLLVSPLLDVVGLLCEEEFAYDS